MKKKIISLCLVVALVATAIAGATLAYFTDAENATNVFTVGDLEITLNDTFVQESELVPGTKTQNAVNKDVSVTNNGSNAAWVRVKIYVPAALDVLTVKPEDYAEIAAQNVLHWNIVSGIDTIWNVEKACWEAKLVEKDGKNYNEYTFYYNEILAAQATTQQLLDQVYLDSKVDSSKAEDGTITYTMNGQTVDLSNLNIIVIAEAIQAAGFDTYEAAFAAFDAQTNKTN